MQMFILHISTKLMALPSIKINVATDEGISRNEI